MLEDVDGLRSWDRRWCFLNNYNISYWKYPEDEYKTSPLGIIDMTNCVTEKVSILPRDICARKYTFELTVAEGETSKRYRLSADTKDQANDWLTNVNYALANLKLWNPKSIKASVKRWSLPIWIRAFLASVLNPNVSFIVVLFSLDFCCCHVNILSRMQMRFRAF